VLVVGNGLTHGWDVDSHQLGVTGQLSRAVSERTGRGCDVDVVGAESMNMRSSLDWIGDRDLFDVDALVVAVGLNDALRLTPVEDWERSLADLLANTIPRLRPDAVVIVTGIPPVGSLPAFDGPIARLTARHRGVLNAAARHVAEFRGVAYLPMAAFTDAVGRHLEPADVYAEFARRIAEVLAPSAVATRPDPEPRNPQDDPIWDWSGTEALVALAANGGASVLRRLATEAQRRFKVEFAIVTLANGDRIYHANNTEVYPASVPVDLAFCKYTVASGEPVVVPDTRSDPRFADNPLTELSYINFYAGYPLRATDGTVIGSFCLQGSRARDADSVPLDELRELAMRAEAEIRRYEVRKGAPPSGAAYTFS
jgi:hypothetical protein